ncbi:ABC transporter substrate-binding protein [Cupriavidus sp. USMAHM13]|uniref:ABC transporter substrate-binding protein n=1 Tax=Cupriavidus sp. USMAHM13 TaxID=1389192 RepID=UPI0012EAB317|nr:ABC transporter substrate-binding protein [Cupriavidus sp. USMAHM13]
MSHGPGMHAAMRMSARLSRPAAAWPADARLALAAVAMLACLAALAWLPPRGLADPGRDQSRGRAAHAATVAPQPRLPGPGPLLRQAQARGVLVVGVPAYPRPVPPGQPLAPEPDPRQATLAAWLAGALGVRLELRAMPAGAAAAGEALPPGVDLVLGGPPPAAGAAPPRATLATPPGRARGALLSLRFAPVLRLDALAGKTACVAHASPYATLLQDAGATLRRYPSPLQALLAFRRGECAVAAEDGALARRLLALPEWRVFRAAPLLLSAPPVPLRLRAPDAGSARYLEARLQELARSGRLAALARDGAADTAFQVMLVESGLICH